MYGINFICRNCGKECFVPNSLLNKKHIYILCSKCTEKCKIVKSDHGIKVQKRKVTKKTGRPNSIISKKRKELLQKYGNKCHNCQQTITDTKYLHLHHIDQNYHNNNDTNLMLLCVTCHAKIHPSVFPLQKCSKEFMKIRNTDQIA